MFAEAVFRSMGRDHRSHKEKANIGWNHMCMEETDLQGCKLGDWAERVDASTYRCKLCNKVGVVPATDNNFYVPPINSEDDLFPYSYRGATRHRRL